MGALGTTTKTSVTVRVKNYVKMAVLVTILNVCQNQQPLDTKSELQETHTDRPITGSITDPFKHKKKSTQHVLHYTRGQNDDHGAAFAL